MRLIPRTCSSVVYCITLAQFLASATLNAQGPRLLHTFGPGHAQSFGAYATSNDGKWMATAANWRDPLRKRWRNGSLTIWRLPQRNAAYELAGHVGEVGSVAFSADGALLASASAEYVGSEIQDEVRIWDVLTGKLSLTLKPNGQRLAAVAFQPGGKLLGLAFNDGIQLWNLTSGSLVRMLRTSEGTGATGSLAFSRDGRLLAAAWRHDIVLWSVDSDRPLGTLEGHTSGVHDAAFNFESTELASAGEDRTVRLWDVPRRSAKAVLRTPGESMILDVDFAEDGAVLGMASEADCIKLWNLTTEDNVATFPLQHGRSLDLAPDGNTLYALTTDAIWIWDTVSAKSTGQLKAASVDGHRDEIFAVAVSPDGKTAASAGKDATICLWSMADRKLIGVLEGHSQWVGDLEFNPQSPDMLASAGGGEGYGEVRFWSVGKRRQTAVWNQYASRVQALEFGPDGKELALAFGDSSLEIWSVARATPIAKLVTLGRSRFYRSLKFSSDGRFLAAGLTSGKHLVELWDVKKKEVVESYEEVTALPPPQYATVAISPDGATIIWSTMRQNRFGRQPARITFWRRGEGQIALRQTSADFIHALAFRPDGKMIVSAGDDGTITLWDAATGNRLGDLRGHEGAVRSIAFTPDGRTLVSGGADRTVKVWQLPDSALERIFSP